MSAYSGWLILILSIASAACGEKPAPANGASVQSGGQPPAPTSLPPGESHLPVPDGRIWYKVSGGGSGTPVILLHGGPGYSSFYLKPFEALGDDRPVVRYDQLGGGKSDRITDTTLFTIAHFVRELDSLRAHLGYSKVHLLGHSWGTILALEYYRVHPEHVASLTLASAALDIPAWERNARRLVGTLSDSAQRAIRTRERQGKFDAPDYQAALGEFYGKYVWRHPVQADLDSLMSTVNEPIYNHMQGPSEFTITGDLDLTSAEDLTALAAAFDGGGVPPLHVTHGADALWYATFETSAQFAEPEPNIGAILAVVESLARPLRSMWDGCTRREFNIGNDCGDGPWAFTQGLPVDLLGRMAAAGASLRVTLYPDREPAAPNQLPQETGGS